MFRRWLDFRTQPLVLGPDEDRSKVDDWMRRWGELLEAPAAWLPASASPDCCPEAGSQRELPEVQVEMLFHLLQLHSVGLRRERSAWLRELLPDALPMALWLQGHLRCPQVQDGPHRVGGFVSVS